MPAEEDLPGLVARWIAKAESDYRAAERLLEDADPLREPIAFHCQQAAEKYLKGFLTRHRVLHPKTHDIRMLLNLVARVEPGMAAALQDLDRLTPYGVETRYPSDFPAMLPGEERRVFALATEARDRLLPELRDFLKKAESA
jgi:HEPN domain-containing protein